MVAVYISQQQELTSVAVKGVYRMVFIRSRVFWKAFIDITGVLAILLHVTSDKVCNDLAISMQAMLVTDEVLLLVF